MFIGFNLHQRLHYYCEVPSGESGKKLAKLIDIEPHHEQSLSDRDFDRNHVILRCEINGSDDINKPIRVRPLHRHIDNKNSTPLEILCQQLYFKLDSRRDNLLVLLFQC